MMLTRRLNIREGERIVTIVRRSLLAHIGTFLLAVASIFLAFFLVTPLLVRGRFGIAIFSVLLAFGLLALARAMWLWYWNAFVVTDARVIDIDQRGFFRRGITEARYEKVDEVAIDIHGILATVFHLGTIRLQTAGGLVRIELRLVPRPEVVQELIGRLQATRPRTHESPGGAQRVDDLDVTALSDAEFMRLRGRVDVEAHRRVAQVRADV